MAGDPEDLPPRSTVHDYLDLWNSTARWIAFITRFMSSAVSEGSAKPARPLHHR